MVHGSIRKEVELHEQSDASVDAENYGQQDVALCLLVRRQLTVGEQVAKQENDGKCKTNKDTQPSKETERNDTNDLKYIHVCIRQERSTRKQKPRKPDTAQQVGTKIKRLTQVGTKTKRE